MLPIDLLNNQHDSDNIRNLYNEYAYSGENIRILLTPTVSDFSLFSLIGIPVISIRLK